jgi:hypothetical protein
MNPELIRPLIWLVIGGGLAYYGYKKGKIVMVEVKQQLFTLPSVIIFIIYAAMLGGIAIPYIWSTYHIEIYSKPDFNKK